MNRAHLVGVVGRIPFEVVASASTTDSLLYVRIRPAKRTHREKILVLCAGCGYYHTLHGEEFFPRCRRRNSTYRGGIPFALFCVNWCRAFIVLVLFLLFTHHAVSPGTFVVYPTHSVCYQRMHTRQFRGFQRVSLRRLALKSCCADSAVVSMQRQERYKKHSQWW